MGRWMEGWGLGVGESFRLCLRVIVQLTRDVDKVDESRWVAVHAGAANQACAARVRSRQRMIGGGHAEAEAVAVATLAIGVRGGNTRAAAAAGGGMAKNRDR